MITCSLDRGVFLSDCRFGASVESDLRKTESVFLPVECIAHWDRAEEDSSFPQRQWRKKVLVPLHYFLIKFDLLLFTVRPC